MNEMLKPCPLCGGAPQEKRLYGSALIECTECHMNGPYTSMSGAYIEKWNTRPVEDALYEAAAKVCRTAGIICEAALQNEANPETPDGDTTTFDLLSTAVEDVKELRAALTKARPKTEDSHGVRSL